MTIDRKDTIRFVLLLCSAVPFFFFLQTSWVRTALLGYLLTACLFGLLLVPDYPPVSTSWFWKALIPIITIHSAIILGLVWLDLRVPEINRMPRMLYGFAAMIVVIEWRLSLRIIETLQPPPSD
jgi:hypothetical protein